jgi:hypothetical protein
LSIVADAAVLATLFLAPRLSASSPAYMSAAGLVSLQESHTGSHISLCKGLLGP